MTNYDNNNDVSVKNTKDNQTALDANKKNTAKVAVDKLDLDQLDKEVAAITGK